MERSLAFSKMVQSVAFKAIASGGEGMRLHTTVMPQPCSLHDVLRNMLPDRWTDLIFSLLVS